MDIQRTVETPRQILAIREKVPMSGLAEFFGRAFEKAASALANAGSHPSGPPIAEYFGTPTTTVDVAAGFPFTGTVTAPPGMTVVEIPGGEVVEVVHTGPYDSMSSTYGELGDYVQASGLSPADIMWEEYLSGPEANPDPSTWRTRVVYPLA